MRIAMAIRAIIILEIQVLKICPITSIVLRSNFFFFQLCYRYFFSADRMAQPTYVNMYELATMAASKAQEHFPPPPPEDCVPNETSFHNEKVCKNSLFYYYIRVLKLYYIFFFFFSLPR